MRRQIEQQARAELVKAGADEKATTRHRPLRLQAGLQLAVRRRPAGARRAKRSTAITIKFAEIGPPPGWKQQGMFAPTRWLLELYPIDEILASELKIDLKNIRFEMMPIGSPAYEVVATAPGGAESSAADVRAGDRRAAVLRSLPRLRARARDHRLDQGRRRRPHGDRRADRDRSRSGSGIASSRRRCRRSTTTSWRSARASRAPEDAPFFGELTVDLTLSEPEYRLPVDQEQISTMEALHEEIYFNTLHFFDVMGRFTRGAGLAYPGRVIPVVHPKADGKPGRAKISVTGFDAPRPSVVVEYVERDGRARRSAARHPEDRGRSAADAGGARARRTRRHRAARSARQGRHRERRARRAGASAPTNCASIARSCRPSRSRAVVAQPCTAARRRPLSRRARLSRSRRRAPHRRLGAREQSRRRKSSRRSIRTARPGTCRTSSKAAPPAAAAAQRRADRPVGHADPAARGLRDPREDVGVQGSDRLQSRPESISARTSGRWT